MIDSTMDSGDYVGLNVGGKIYGTSRTTLTRYPDSFFTAMLDGSIPSARDDQGNYLIDRDGEVFRHVLNYLRCGELVVPENFSEFGLLEREADFFLLQELKLSISGSLASEELIGLMFDNGNLFKITRKTLLREEDSFFTKMLNGDVPVLRDSRGNYVMERDGSHFHHVIQYLRDGGIFSTIEINKFDHLRNKAEYFQLKEFAKHIESVCSMRIKARQNTIEARYARNMSVDFYFHLDSPSVAYASGTISIWKQNYLIGDGATAGVVDLQKLTGKDTPTLQDVLAYFKRIEGNENSTTPLQLSTNCTKLSFKHPKE